MYYHVWEYTLDSLDNAELVGRISSSCAYLGCRKVTFPDRFFLGNHQKMRVQVRDRLSIETGEMGIPHFVNGRSPGS